LPRNSVADDALAFFLLATALMPTSALYTSRIS